MAKVRITDKDRGYNALVERLKSAMGDRAVTVGIHAAEGGAQDGDSGLTVADVGTIHEFGLGNNPERSFVRAYADEKKDENRAMMRKLAEGLITGASPSADVVLKKAGLMLVAGMQGRIAEGIDPPNEESTVRRKGSSTPLIDKGQLRSSITYKVE